MEESGDESDDVYDQFDLGDFTKEEIKIYESMVGPGERLRDAALPETPIAQTRETSCEIQGLDRLSYLTLGSSNQPRFLCSTCGRQRARQSTP